MTVEASATLDAGRPDAGRPFVFIHVGDLHVTALPKEVSPQWHRRERRLRSDLSDILAEIAGIRDRAAFDFVFLPGDLAENGCEEEYDAIAEALGRHEHLRVCLIPGDHDRARGKDSLEHFARFRAKLSGAQKHPPPVEAFVERRVTACPPPREQPKDRLTQFYYSRDIGRVRCIFLDCVSAGRGQKGWGLDFRLGASQAAWLSDTVEQARDSGVACAVFTHCYPSDMHEADEGTALAGLFWDGGVRLVEMGHTHYNELGHDGRTQYGAARSVGQNEDGPAGYAVVALDDDVTSWRFKQLQLPWPFVMITQPADRRLATKPLEVDGHGRVTVRALVLSDEDVGRCTVTCRADDGIRVPMHPVGGSMVEAKLRWPAGSRAISVEVSDPRTWGKDRADLDTIEPALGSPDYRPRSRPDKLGSPASSVGSWPVKGLRGDPQGPNNGGHKW